ncbi:CaiB/BaiF CoA transferase family protein [Allobacillus sp. GCM10007491]|uniref:CoA transferase n=1 Tax=Allobacillus saliphilus TaxID=2912308 RepID=A0A941CVH8_9BACI|nr:CoA transferase [Allobacillus saliphilus]MBR7553881.1 CoA transferase [Allobacillus saliphilus]MBR7554825.1 CoA transferase [Allobacillus saliphilus]
MSLPLGSVRVLDLTRLLPGPYCTLVLADFGAEVIKVEDPAKGDYTRDYHPKLDQDGVYFHSLNRNKKSICLDLKSEDGKNYFLKLVKNADVVVESFRPGVMERLGLGYEKLKQVNEKIIYCAITGYGQTGPYRDRPGHDVNYISYAGLLQLMGEKDGKPVIPATQIADIGGGALPAVIGILLALLDREKSGKGQFVDISMLDGVISWLQLLLPGFLVKDSQPKRGEQMLSGALACYEVYQAKDGKWLSVGALEPKFWVAFCKAIERDDLIPKLDAPPAVQEQMKEEIGAIISTKPIDEWMKVFNEVDSCVSPLLSFEELVNDPQVNDREMIRTVAHDTLGEMKQIGIPIKLSETPGAIQTQAPKLGEHTHEVLKEIIGVK